MNLKIAQSNSNAVYTDCTSQDPNTMDGSECEIQVMDMLWCAVVCCASVWYGVPIEINENCALRSHRAKRKHTHTKKNHIMN